MDFERECRSLPQAVNRNITLAEYTELWLRDITPNKLAKSTLIRERQDTEMCSVINDEGFFRQAVLF